MYLPSGGVTVVASLDLTGDGFISAATLKEKEEVGRKVMQTVPPFLLFGWFIYVSASCVCFSFLLFLFHYLFYICLGEKDEERW